MVSYQLINKLDHSEGSNKDIALKYDAGKVKTEKYGEAMLSGYFLLITRNGEFPPVYVKQIEEKSHKWLNEMGLEEYQDELMNKITLPSMIAFTAPGIDPEKLELYFKVMSFAFLFDDAFTKLKHLNKKNVMKHQEDVVKLVERFVFIVKSHGNGVSTEAAISNLNPTFKSMGKALSHICSYGLKHMRKNDYERLARELMDFIRVNKWIQEYHDKPYSENEYLFIRLKDIGVYLALEAIYFAADLQLSDEIRMHPLFQKYLEILNTQVSLVNDVLSLRKETADDEEENFVLVKCQKYNLQKSIYKTEKAANEMIFDLKKCGIKLNSYFPSDNDLKNFIKAMEYMIDGFLYWYQYSRRYGNLKLEKYEVKYDYDYNSWLKTICLINVENMKEPTLSE